MHAVTLTSALLFAGVVAALQACSTGCDNEIVLQAVAFVDAHQTCMTDDDCRIVSDACGEIPGGSCGQLAMNRQGAESVEWAALSTELEDCTEDSCVTCAAGLSPSCNNGSCR